MAIGGVDYDRTNGTITTINDTWTWNTTEGKWQRDSDGKLLLVSLDEDHNGISTDEMCFLCHNSTFFGLSATHTDTVVRGCDDDRCHGNAVHQYNDPGLFPNASSSAVHAGYFLSKDNTKNLIILLIGVGTGVGVFSVVKQLDRET